MSSVEVLAQALESITTLTAEQVTLEEEKKKANNSPRRDMYRDKDGNVFDPAKKFGIIQDNSLIYGNVTSSYPLNLPTDYYQKYIV